MLKDAIRTQLDLEQASLAIGKAKMLVNKIATFPKPESEDSNDRSPKKDEAKAR